VSRLALTSLMNLSDLCAVDDIIAVQVPSSFYEPVDLDYSFLSSARTVSSPVVDDSLDTTLDHERTQLRDFILRQKNTLRKLRDRLTRISPSSCLLVPTMSLLRLFKLQDPLLSQVFLSSFKSRHRLSSKEMVVSVSRSDPHLDQVSALVCVSCSKWMMVDFKDHASKDTPTTSKVYINDIDTELHRDYTVKIITDSVNNYSLMVLCKL